MKEENTYNEHIGINLPDDLRMNPFSVPNGYFDELRSSINARLTEQKLKESTKTAEDGFVVPKGYFDDFASQVNARIAVEKLQDEVSETGFRVPESYFQDSQANIKASIFVEKLRDQVVQDGFSVPQGYFEELAARSIALAKVDQSMASTQLAVPEGYFDTLSARIQAKVATDKTPSSPDKTDTPLIRMPAYRNWAQYAAAAVVLFFVGWGAYWAVDSSSRPAEQGNMQELALEDLSNEEIFNYLTQVTEGVELIELATFLPENNADEVNVSVEDQEIEEYLNYML